MAAHGPVPYPVSARQPLRRRRRPLPAITLIVLLGVVATIVWIRTFENSERKADNSCAPPGPVSTTEPGTQPGTAQPGAPGGAPGAPGSAPGAAPGGPPGAAPGAGQPPAATPPPPLGTLLAPDSLDSVEPLPPDAVKVRVLNANGQRGQASLIAAKLSSDLGFGSAGEPANDPVYPAWDLSCIAQIRFGTTGDAAARTLSLVVPCAELIRDTRADDTVDLALGHQFEDLRPNSAAKQVLRKLTEIAEQPPDPTGGQQAATATVDPALIAAARRATC